VLLDNNYITWLNYNNQYWPAHYLIDKEGRVVYEHFGEGDYEKTEQNIRILLGLAEKSGPEEIKHEQKIAAPMYSQTPEIYLGYARANTFSSPERMVHNKISTYTLPEQLTLHHWALQGPWQIETDKIISEESNNRIILHFSAAKVFGVFGTTNNQSVNVQVIIKNENGKAIQGKEDKVQIKEHRLYELINLPEPTTGFLELITDNPGLEIYTFTFGN
jgi:hypothetical protein